jgi:hypothetical protein
MNTGALVRVPRVEERRQTQRLMWERADVVLAHLLPHGLPEGTPTAFTQVGHIGEALAPLSPHSLPLTRFQRT